MKHSGFLLGQHEPLGLLQKAICTLNYSFWLELNSLKIILVTVSFCLNYLWWVGFWSKLSKQSYTL